MEITLELLIIISACITTVLLPFIALKTIDIIDKLTDIENELKTIIERYREC